MQISVVIPLFNKEPYICRAIESVLRQNELPDEIVVVDDGSTDRSPHEVLKISDPRIRLIQQANAGECAARNRGVAESKNKIVAFLDADDEWKPDFLSHIQRLVNNFPDCGAYATFYEVAAPGGSTHYPQLKNFHPAPWIGILPFFFRILQTSLPFCSSSIAIPKKVYDNIGGFPSGVKRGGDLMMWIRLGLNYPIAYCPSRQAIYHTDADNRACVVFPNTGEPESARLIAQLLENNEVPIDLVDDIKDYYAIEQISKAQELIIDDHSMVARELLTKVISNQKYWRKRLWWYFWSFVPYPIVNFIVNIRND